MSKNNKSARTHAEILDVAWALIAAEGADVPITKIAAAVGLTRQSIYVHFGSRSGLLIELVRRADDRENIWGHFQDALSNPTAITRLETCLNAWFDFVPKIYPVASDLIRLKARDKDASTAWYDRMSELHEFLRARIEDLNESNLLKESWTVEQAADYLWAQCSVQNWELLVHDRGWEPVKASNLIQQTTLQALIKSNHAP